MDPLSALSLASNVVQLVDFGSRLISKSQEVYKSADGTSNVNGNLETITKDLTRICSSLIQPEHYINKEQASVPEIALIPLCRSCKKLGDEFLSVLKTLKVKGRHQKWSTVRQALRTAWKESTILSYEKRLGDFRSQIVAHLISILRYVNVPPCDL